MGAGKRVPRGPCLGALLLADGAMHMLPAHTPRPLAFFHAAEPEETDTDGSIAPSTSAAPPNRGGQGAQAGQGRGVCLVLGTEGQGLSRTALQRCSPVAIPMAGGAMESLNVGVAGAILMFALSRGMPELVGRLHGLGAAQAEPPPAV